VCTGFWWRSLREGYHLEDQGVDWKIILKWILKKWNGSIDWIDLARYRDMFYALVNAIMNLQSSIKRGEFLD
jgi:hypothetical protein